MLLEVYRIGPDKGWGLRSRTLIRAGAKAHAPSHPDVSSAGILIIPMIQFVHTAPSDSIQLPISTIEYSLYIHVLCACIVSIYRASKCACIPNAARAYRMCGLV
eukprot:COSAG01_NODE_33890_length_556_cov_48.214442_1_plen_103_part_10